MIVDRVVDHGVVGMVIWNIGVDGDEEEFIDFVIVDHGVVEVVVE